MKASMFEPQSGDVFIADTHKIIYFYQNKEI